MWGILVFLSNVLYVKCGVFFVFYLNNMEMGCNLVVFVFGMVNGNLGVCGVLFLWDVLIVFNICIVSYFGLNLLIV